MGRIMMNSDIVFKVLKEYYPNNIDIRNVFKYVAGEGKHKKTVYCAKGRGLPNNPDEAAECAIKIQKYYSKANKRRIYHYILSFPSYVEDMEYITDIVQYVLKVFFHVYKHQVYYGIHNDTNNFHVHFLVNAVNYRNGSKWHQGSKELEKLKRKIKSYAVVSYNQKIS